MLFYIIIIIKQWIIFSEYDKKVITLNKDFVKLMNNLIPINCQ